MKTNNKYTILADVRGIIYSPDKLRISEFNDIYLIKLSKKQFTKINGITENLVRNNKNLKEVKTNYG